MSLPSASSGLPPDTRYTPDCACHARVISPHAGRAAKVLCPQQIRTVDAAEAALRGLAAGCNRENRRVGLGFSFPAASWRCSVCPGVARVFSSFGTHQSQNAAVMRSSATAAACCRLLPGLARDVAASREGGQRDWVEHEPCREAVMGEPFVGGSSRTRPRSRLRRLGLDRAGGGPSPAGRCVAFLAPSLETGRSLPHLLDPLPEAVGRLARVERVGLCGERVGLRPTCHT
jgi:hypothetical protein